MHRHPHFDLYLHDDHELEALLKTQLKERRSIHDWPLSSVEVLSVDQGQAWIYKAQRSPSVEAEFYSQARSKLLMAAQVIPSSKPEHSYLLFPYHVAPLLSEQILSDQEALSIARNITGSIAEIQGELPSYLDVSSVQRWTAEMTSMFETMESLISQNLYQHVSARNVALLQERAFSQQVQTAVVENTGLVHHDLRADNILLTPDGYRVIDWQRPILGPRDLDLATLLFSLGKDPSNLVTQGLLWIMYLLHIHWLVACSVRWFPAGSAHYDQAVAELAKHFKVAKQED